MQRQQKRALKWVFGSFGLVVLPWLPTMLAGLISSMFDCALNEAQVHPCIVAGTDIGSILYSMGVFGWVAIFISPILFLGCVVCLIWFLKELCFTSSR